ncbi:hypothetical protein K474DRAFT_1660123 [Panus rudis PR-1116 ss-1]|nr:hypothetical protein K474DRAFT_1660123 [Panus rudis PR-1116 ss-1]
MADFPGHLPRGKACIPCRRRKMKCDGNKPICNQCLRFNRPHECEFSENTTPSTARVLEQHIARLQSRIQELEQNDPNAVKLYDPYARSQQSAPPTQHMQWWESPEPPQRVAQTLVSYFLAHGTKIGLFFEPTQLTERMFNPTVNRPRPVLAVRNAIYLWGISLSQDPQLQSKESLFLSRTLISIHASLSSGLPQDTLYVLQAEILIAYYFYHKDRLLEGKFHSNAAVSLALLCGLHKAGAEWGDVAVGRQDLGMNLSLPAPRTSMELGQRIHAWWATFILDKCWVVALGAPSAIVEEDDDPTSGIQIATPWPLDLVKYSELPGLRGGATIRAFLHNLHTGVAERDPSYWTTCAKAASLYERAVRRAAALKQGQSSQNGEMAAFDKCLDRFTRHLPTPERINPEILHVVLLGHSLAHAAIIQLHFPFADRSSTSRSRCLAAANSIIRLLHVLPVRQLPYVNPTLATIWANAAQVLVNGVISLRSMQSAIASSGALPGEDVLLSALAQVIQAMEHFAPSCPYMSTKLAEIRRYHNGI